MYICPLKRTPLLYKAIFVSHDITLIPTRALLNIRSFPTSIQDIMPLQTPQPNCPDEDVIALQSRVFTQARAGARLPKATGAPPSYIGERKAPTRPPTYRATSNTSQGRPKSYAYDFWDQAFDASRPIIPRYTPPCYREWPLDHLEDQGEAGEEIVDVHSLAGLTGDTHTTRKYTKTGKGSGWVFYIYLLVAIGVFLGSLGYFIPKYCKSHYG